jgi:BMFP domain-containing protein YqiC
MSDTLERSATAESYQKLELLADISELHVDSRMRLMAIIDAYREREWQLEARIRELQARLADATRAHRPKADPA